jgi:peptidoglycan/LPS O-acetylase OafA/YrhL
VSEFWACHYLYHGFAIHVVTVMLAAAELESLWLRFAGSLLLAIGVAELSFRILEERLAAMRKRLRPSHSSGPS